MELINALHWRYATKQMTGEKLDQSLVDQIIEAARLAPTSAGLQPFRIISITNPALKEKIAPLAMNQPQITQCSHLLVFVSWDTMSDERIEAMYDYINAQRSLPSETTAEVVNNLKGLFSTFTPEQQYHHSAKQAHIGVGLAVAAASLLRVDATPMEGFDKTGLDQLLNLKERGLQSVLLLALGRRDAENDWLLNLKKIRVPTEDFVIEMD
ncbi:nitroreductase family protein [Ectopseudomonas mendocina]|uniref:Nitroreductase family protein n=1 Tax=Ectopseudomonas mendocina TaxID=300 RepID=A0ABZ2RH21_ECTME